MCRFACTTYDEKFLELTTYEQGLPVEGLDVFLIKMETLGDTITDLTPPVSDTNMHEYENDLPLAALIPALMAAGKVAALGEISDAAGYGVKKGLKTNLSAR